MRHLLVLLALAALTACAGDPLKDVPRLEDVDVAAPTPVVEAVAAPQESDGNVGFFQRIMRKREVAPATDEATAETGDAEATSAKTTQVDPQVSQDAEVEPKTKPTRQGWLFGRKARSETVNATRPEAQAETKPDATSDTEVMAETPPAAPQVSSKKRGLFGWGDKKNAKPETKPETLQQASLTPQAASDSAVQEAAKSEKAARTGLFSKKKATRLTGPDARVVAPGEVLPFGEVARACHMKRGQLGREVAKYPEKGAKFRVYDSAPGTLALHTFYITGFKDGCPRQITAALAVFGSAGMYETLRYGLPVKARSKKPTDIAYEKLKSRTCGVSKTKPCGAKLKKMEKNTVFLSVYNRFVGAQGWTNLLLSDGKVLAKDG